jgi:hypothetical protein
VYKEFLDVHNLFRPEFSSRSQKITDTDSTPAEAEIFIFTNKNISDFVTSDLCFHSSGISEKIENKEKKFWEELVA